MLPAIDQFDADFVHVRTMIGLGTALEALAPGLDVSETYRAGLTMAVSALDHYVHERTLQGMLDVYLGSRPHTAAYDRFNMRIQSLHQGLIAPVGSVQWLESEIRHALSFRTCQKPEDVADAMRLFSDAILWPTVGGQLGLPHADVKGRLTLIVDRRNKIAHEFDNEPTGLGLRWPMSYILVDDTASFIESVVHAIDIVVA